MLWLSWNLAQTVDGKSSTPLNAEAQFKNHTPFAGTYRDCRLNCFMSLYIFIYTEKKPKNNTTATLHRGAGSSQGLTAADEDEDSKATEDASAFLFHGQPSCMGAMVQWFVFMKRWYHPMLISGVLLPCWWSCNKDFAQTGDHMVNIGFLIECSFVEW